MKRTTSSIRVLLGILLLFVCGTAFAGSPLTGNYTINPAASASSTNFTTFQMAVDSLETNGVSGAVIITITAGTYTEQITIGAITGISSVNDVTFQGNMSSISDVKLTHASTGSSTNWTLQLDGASYINFKYITFENTGSSYARVVFFDGGNNNITFLTNEFIGKLGTSTSNSYALIYNESGTSSYTNNCLFNGNTFTNGSYGAYWYGGGSGANSNEVGNQFMSNQFNNQRYSAIFFYYQGDGLLSDNVINLDANATSTVYGIRYYYSDSSSITSNEIVTGGSSTQYGIYLYYSKNTSANHTLVANNMVTTSATNTGSVYGIYPYNCLYVDIFHNSVNVRAGSTTASRALYLNSSSSGAYGNIDIRNNIFVNSGGNMAAEVSSNSANFTGGYATLNYNNYYSSGAAPFRYASSVKATFADWQTSTSGEAQGVWGDPLFATSTDLHIIGTTVNDVGDNTVGITTDIDGDTRPFTGATIVDIGADEFAPPSCTQSSGLVTNTLTATTANVGWASTSGATSWNIEYGATGFTPGTGTVVVAGTNPFTITSLTAQTTYDFYVQDNCGASGNSAWAGPGTFTTYCATQLSGTVTIDPSMASSSTNFQSFAAFITELNTCGVSGPVTVNVKEGTYTGQLDFGGFVGASSTNVVTIQSNPSNTNPVVLTYTPAGSADNWTVQMDAASHYAFDGITFTSGGTSYAQLVRLKGTCANISFSNNIFNGVVTTSTSTNYAAFYYGSLMSVDGLTIDNNTFNNGSYCAYLNGSSSAPGDDLVITNNVVMGSRAGGFRGSYWDNVTVQDNDITLSSGTSTQYGIYFSNSGTLPGLRAIIERNDVKINTTSTVYGIYVNYFNALISAPSIIVNNMISNSATTGTGTRYALYIYHVANMNIYHNSVSILDGSATSGYAAYFGKSTSTSYFTPGAVSVKNNIFSNTGGGRAIYVTSAATTGFFTSIDYNLYNTTGSNPFFWGVNQADLAAWKTASSMDANAIAGDPIFSSPNDLHLIGIAANDVGDNTVGVAVDIDGDTRPLAPSTVVDIGADEYAASSCTPPTGLTAMSVANNSVGVYWTTGGATDWMLQYGATGFVLGSGTLMPSSNDTATISPLMASTSYDIYVKDSCSASSTSAWFGPLTVTTLCDPVTTFPYSEGFEGTSWTIPTSSCNYADGIDNCWSRTPNGYSPMSWVMRTGTTCSSNTGPPSANGGSNYVYLETSSSGSDAVLNTPSFNLTSLSNAELRFYYHMFGAAMGNMYIEASTNGGSSWSTLDSIVGTQHTATDPWSERIVDLSSLAGTVQIRFRGTYGGTFTGDMGIDDVSVAEAPVCASPTMLTALASTTTSASFYFVAGGAADFNYEYGPVGFTVGSGTYASSVNDTVTITALTAATEYDLFVRDSCAVGNTSAWVGPIRLTTLVCSPSNACAYTIYLHDSYGDGWNGSIVAVKQQGITVATFGASFVNGYEDTAYIQLCDLDTAGVYLEFLGPYSNEMGFDIHNPQGYPMLSHLSGSFLTTNQHFGDFYGQCAIPSCSLLDSVVVADETSCGPNPVTFTASGKTNMNAEYVWMRSPDSAIIGYGENFTTPPITAQTDYHVGIFAIDDTKSSHNVGALPSLAGGFGNYTNGQWFHADEFFYLDSITVKSNGMVTFQVMISEATATGGGPVILRSDTIVVSSAGDHQVQVGMGVAPGNYFISIDFSTSGTTGLLHRATSGASYPYTISNIVSIDSCNFSPIRYYYTYDWVVREVCHGPIETATAFYSPVPATAIPYMEDFNSGQPCNWTTEALTTGVDWMNVSDYSGNSLDSTDFMMLDDDGGTSSAITEASLISPEFYTLGYDTLWIEFDHYFRATGGSTGDVEVWDGSAWQSIYSVTANTGAWFSPDHQAIDVSMYANPNFKVRFRYDDNGSFAWYWSVDNFELNGNQLPCQNVVVDILTDNFGSEVSWSIVDTATGTIYGSGGPYPDAIITHYIDTLCLPTGVFFDFRIEDSYGDGLFDGTNTGTYDVDILCSWGNNNVISGSAAFPYGGTANPPSWDSVVFEVTCLINCTDPDSLIAIAACEQAALSWTSEPNAVSTLEWGMSGFTPGSGTLIPNATSPYLLGSLSVGTSYDFWVRDSCFSGSLSNWAGPFTFTTDTMPIASFTANMNAAPHPDTVQYGFSALASTNANTYWWDYGDGSANDTAAFTIHNYGQNGSYTVTLVVTNNCGSDTTTMNIDIEGIGLDEYGFGNISIFPNPNNGFFTISGITNFGDNAIIEVISMTGVTVYSKTVNANNSETVDIDLRGYAQGMYQVRVSNSRGVGIKPVVIRN